MTSSADVAHYLNMLQDAVLSSAREIVALLSDPASIECFSKPDSSLVMNIDIASEHVFNQKLAGVLQIVSEENEDSHSALQKLKDFFLVDPLDGTSSCRRFALEPGGQVGFGPLAGLVLDGRLEASCFYHVPERALYFTRRGEGVKRVPLDLSALNSEVEISIINSSGRTLPKIIAPKIERAAILFYPGSRGELCAIDKLRRGNIIENLYRFGGFANDCVRLACGREQGCIQFSVKAWDYVAALFAIETGYEVILNPLGAAESFIDWPISLENPLMICLPEHKLQLLRALGGE